MTDMLCGYIDRDETIVAFLYDDLDEGRRRDFEAHVLTCAVCRSEVAGLRSVRTQLAKWEPPAVASLQSSSPAGPVRQSSWQTIPAWAQVAAALLFVGVSAGLANLDVRYDANGLTVRTGWMQSRSAERSAASAPTATDRALVAPWKTDLAALEQQLKSEWHTSQVSAAASVPTRPASAADAETLRRVRLLLDESEKRQQRELALRVAEVLRDVNAQRQADLVKIDRTLGVISNNTGVEVLKSRREMMDYLKLVSQRQ